MLIIVLGVAYFQLQDSSIQRDKESMCRVDKVIEKETVIVIDATDSFSNTQSILLEKEISKILNSALIDERFSLYVLSEEVGEESNLVVVCNPGDGRDKSELISNKSRIKRKWETNFYNKLTQSVKSITGQHTSKYSPIMEMIKYASIKGMYGSTAPKKRFIIASDMLHHTREYSQYKQKLNIEKFLKSPYYIEVRPHLESVDIEILYLVRAKDIKLQNRGHISFWESYLTNSGGNLIRVKSMN